MASETQSTPPKPARGWGVYKRGTGELWRLAKTRAMARALLLEMRPSAPMVVCRVTIQPEADNAR